MGIVVVLVLMATCFFVGMRVEHYSMQRLARRETWVSLNELVGMLQQLHDRAKDPQAVASMKRLIDEATHGIGLVQGQMTAGEMRTARETLSAAWRPKDDEELGLPDLLRRLR